MLYGFLIVLQMLISILLVVAILLQASKGGGLAGIAGGAMQSSVFGGRSAANFLTKATTILATVFMLNCLGMAVLSTAGKQSASVTQQAAQAESANSPVPSIPEGEGEPAPSSGEAAPTGN